MPPFRSIFRGACLPYRTAHRPLHEHYLFYNYYNTRKQDVNIFSIKVMPLSSGQQKTAAALTRAAADMIDRCRAREACAGGPEII